MATDKRVVFAFFWRRKWFDTTQLTVGLKLLASASENLVAISLVAYVPYNAVFGRVEHVMESNCKLYDTEAGGQVSRVN